MIRRSIPTAIFCCLGSATVFAQGVTSDDALDEPQTLNKITIQGEIQQRDIQESLTSAVVITGDELDVSNDANLYNVVERTPGINASFGEKGFSIRGIDQRGFGGGRGLTIRTSIDGAELPSNQASFFGPYSTWDLAQVEILRGPQSTQQGRNALAGTINIRTADPVLNQLEGKARIDAGERATSRLAAAYNVPLGDAWALRLTAESYETDGFVENRTLNTDDHDARELDNYRAKLLFKPNDKFQAILSYNYTENFGGEDFVEFSTYPGERISLSNVDEREGSEHTITALDIEYVFNSLWSLSSKTVLYDHDNVRLEDSDASPVDGGQLFRNATDESITQEVKIIYNGQNKWRGAFGLYYTDIENTDDAGGEFPGEVFNPALAGLGTRLTVSLVSENNVDNIALFSEFDYDLSDKVTLTFGARYDRENVDFNDASTFALDPPVVPLPPSDPTRGDTDYEAFLPKFAVNYSWSDQFSTGATVQRGYRAGGSQRNLITGVLNEFDPEYTVNIEFSSRYQSIDQRTTLNANVFFTDWTDQQVSVAGPSGNPNDVNTLNAGESSINGLEVEFEHRFTDSFDVFSSLAIVKTELDNFVSGGEDFSGNEFQFAPELTAALGANYYFANGWVLIADGSFTDEQQSDLQNNPLGVIPSRTLWNVRLGYESSQWSAFLYVRNLLDEDYYTQPALSSNVLGAPGAVIQRVRTGEPRFAGVQFNVSW